jgi:CDP-diacylglycerol--glycerol-3-phosphate 3-phosphatidyltransferase
MWVLAVASMITCAQRLHTVRHSAGAAEPFGAPDEREKPEKSEP